jgi:hypothetical protein
MAGRDGCVVLLGLTGFSDGSCRRIVFATLRCLRPLKLTCGANSIQSLGLGLAVVPSSPPSTPIGPVVPANRGVSLAFVLLDPMSHELNQVEKPLNAALALLGAARTGIWSAENIRGCPRGEDIRRKGRIKHASNFFTVHMWQPRLIIRKWAFRRCAASILVLPVLPLLSAHQGAHRLCATAYGWPSLRLQTAGHLLVPHTTKLLLAQFSLYQ